MNRLISVFIISALFYFIPLIKTQSCENIETPSENNCKEAKTREDEVCCYYLGLEEGPNFCKLLPSSSVMDYFKYDFIENKAYKVICEYDKLKIENSVLSRCGKEGMSPSLKKCKKYSSYVDSCCYYKGKNEDNEEPYPQTEKGCYWLGAKFDGTITWGGMKLQCSSCYIKISFILLSLAMIFIFF